MNDSTLAAGDRFVLPRLLAQALREHAGESLQIREHELPWPDEPFADVAEVSEACGSEEEIIEALREARVCVTQVAPITRRVLEACPRLEFVGGGGRARACDGGRRRSRRGGRPGHPAAPRVRCPAARL